MIRIGENLVREIESLVNDYSNRVRSSPSRPCLSSLGGARWR
jgi:hypothetical protein